MIQKTMFGTYELIGEEDGEQVTLFEGTYEEVLAWKEAQCEVSGV